MTPPTGVALEAPTEPFRPHQRSGRSRLAMAGVGWSFLNTALGAGLSALVFALASRVLTPEDFGVVALAAAIVMFLGCLTPVAFAEALVQVRDLGPQHLDSVFWAALGTSAVLFVGLCLAAPLIADWAEAPLLTGLLPFIGLRLLIDAMAAVPAAIVQRAMNFRALAQRTAIANLIGGLACLGLIWAGFGLWALAATQVLTALVALIALMPAARWWPGRQLSRSAMRDIASFGLFSAGTRFLAEMRVDQMMLGLIAGPAALGLFYFARRLFQILGDLTSGAFNPVSTVLLASFQDEPQKRREAFLITCHASAALAMPVFVGLVVVAGTGVPLIFGEHWREAIPALQAFAVVGIIASLGVVQAALIRAAGRADWWFGYQALVQMSALPIIWVVMPHGLDAVVWALTLRVLVLWPLSVRMTMRLLDLPLRDYARAVAAPLLAATFMAGAILALDPMLEGTTPALRLAVEILWGAIAYLAAVIPLSWSRLRHLRAILRNRKAKQ